MRKTNKIITMILVAIMVMTTITFCNKIKAEAKTFTQTGGYSTELSTKKDKSNQYYSYAKKLVFKSTKFTTYGSMHYTAPGDVYSSKIYKRAKRTYVISGSCKYYKMTYKNGKMKRKKISKKVLRKLVLPLDKGSYTNRSLAWDIKDGKVVKMEYREY